MKRVGNIFDAVVERENLRDAFLKASRGKRHRLDQRQYADNLDNELDRLREGLLNVDYPVGNYRRFKIYDPKEREICVAPFGERVLHHALMNVCEPWFDKWLVFDTYACRAGKGQLRAVRKHLAEAEGVAVFAVATNEQLAQFAKERATTLAALQAVPGFGESRAEKYGKAFIEAIATRDESDKRDESDLRDTKDKRD